MKYIDAEKLKSIIKVQIKERKEWMKDIDRSYRQDQLWSDLNGEDMSILQIINSLQQEQPEVDFEKEVDKLWQEGVNGLFGFNDSAVDFARIRNIARHFYELGLNARKEETK